jgi:3-dehydrotetronate 4-kinase
MPDAMMGPVARMEPDSRLGPNAVIGVIADDLTGASDIAGILSRAGARTRLVPGVPPGPAALGADALVVGLKTRTAPVAGAVAQSLAALDWLRAAGVRQVIFKVCSTFDSTPEGNIGPVALALLDALQAPGAAVCPAFPANGRRVFMGHLFVGDRLLNESGMQHHPLTPMTDPDLRRWLARQIAGPVGHLAREDLRDAGSKLGARYAAGERLVICDAIDDADLSTLATGLNGAALIVGGSAIAMGLPANFGLKPVADAPRVGATPGCVLSGSCSMATLGQVAVHAARHPVLQVGPADMSDPAATLRRALDFLSAHRNDRPLIASTAPPDEVAAAQATHGREALAARFDRFFADLAVGARNAGFRAIVVAGGETSGAVMQALGPLPYDIGAEIAPGVPALYPAETGHGLALKSGNFGGPDFFARALDQLEAGQ